MNVSEGAKSVNDNDLLNNCTVLIQHAGRIFRRFTTRLPKWFTVVLSLQMCVYAYQVKNNDTLLYTATQECVLYGRRKRSLPVLDGHAIDVRLVTADGDRQRAQLLIGYEGTCLRT